MTTEISTLGIGIDPRESVKGARVVNRALDSVGDKAEKETKQVNKLAASFQSLASKAAGPLGGLLAFAGVSAGAETVRRAISGLVNVNREFGQTLAELSAITGATGQDLRSLELAAREMGATTTLSASQAAEALKLVASAKPDLLENVDALAAVTEEAQTLAIAAGIDLPTAANALGLSLNQFGAAADEANRFINVLAAGAKFGASEVFQTARAVKESGVVAASAGLSYETLNAAIQTLAGNGIKASQAGTALRNIITKLSVDTEKFNPEIVGLVDALRNLGREGLTTAQIVKKFGLENQAAARLLINNADAIGELEEKLTGTQTAAEQAAIQMDTLDGDLLSLDSAVEELALTLGDELEPIMRDLVQSTKDWVIEISDAIKAVGIWSTESKLAAKERELALFESNERVRADNEGLFDLLSKGLDGLAAGTAAYADSAENSWFRVNRAIGRALGNVSEVLSESAEFAGAETAEAYSEAFKAQLRAEIATLRGELAGPGVDPFGGVGAPAPPPAAADPEAAGNAAEKATKKTKGLTDAQRERNRLEGEWGAILRSIQTPQERYAENVARIEKLQSEGIIPNQELYLRALEAEKEALDEIVNSGAREKLIEQTDRWKSLVEGIRTPQQEYNVAIAELEDLLSAGVVDDMAAYNALLEEQNRLLEETKQSQLEATVEYQNAISAAEDLGGAFETAFEDAIVSGESLRNVVGALASDIQAIILRRAIVDPLADSLTGTIQNGLLTANAGGGGFLGNLFGGLFGGLPSAQQGGTLTIPGPASVNDNKVVGVRVRSGEEVSFRQRGETELATIQFSQQIVLPPGNGGNTRASQNQLASAGLRSANRALARFG